jgi:hypothetical protein
MVFHSDIEVQNEREPLMDGQNTRGANNAVTSQPHVFSRLLHFFGGGIYAPDASTYDPIETLLNTEDPEERDRLTERWRDNRLAELSFIGVVVSASNEVGKKLTLTHTGCPPRRCSHLNWFLAQHNLGPTRRLARPHLLVLRYHTLPLFPPHSRRPNGPSSPHVLAPQRLEEYPEPFREARR